MCASGHGFNVRLFGANRPPRLPFARAATPPSHPSRARMRQPVADLPCAAPRLPVRGRAVGADGGRSRRAARARGAYRAAARVAAGGNIDECHRVRYGLLARGALARLSGRVSRHRGRDF